MGITSALTAMFTAISEAFKSLTQCKQVQSESSILRELKRKSKAIDYAEKIIYIIDKSTLFEDDRAYKRYRRAFFKFN